jgi:YidC/Oxa1 family membrane protein insertase
MKFYKENGVNPLAGCLPMIPQMIIFFSLFYVLRAIAEWKPGQASKYGLTTPVLQSAQKATIFGVHLGDKLLFSHQSVPIHVAIVIVLTVIVSASTTFMTVRQTSKRGLMQTNTDPDNPMAGMQKYMMYIVPFFSLTGLYWQYGLVLYWVTTNLWTLGQQFFMFRGWTAEDAAAASATAAAAAAGGSARASTQTAARPGSGTAKPAAGSSSGVKSASGAAKTTAGTTKATAAKTATNGTRSAGAGAGAAKPATAATADTAARSTSGANGRSSTSRPAAATTSSAQPRTGSARGDAAAASASGSPNGQNGGGAMRGLLRMGRAKPEPVPEPEVPATKVVRQQPVRQNRNKRSGKR